MNEKNKNLGLAIVKKNQLLNQVYENTFSAFNIFKTKAKNIISELANEHSAKDFLFSDKGEFEFDIRFGTDVLIFSMHTNVFEFSRLHEVMKLPYIKEDKERSFCGVINIYNFLADSFDYRREDDLGYLIGRVFINRDNHYFIEGKREIGLLYSNFNTAKINEEAIENIICSAMEYANNFDLLTPPFEEVKVITAGQILALPTHRKQITAKRLGFEFKQDTE
ncbi:MAG: hypothetical protein LBR17_05575 [Bacteroidales bacterium]|jgi:hypothetical protein|nr:hypothetical protein [Bacteroidales bacterium]